MKIEIQRKDFLKSWKTIDAWCKNEMIGIRVTADEFLGVRAETTTLKSSLTLKNLQGTSVLEPGQAVIPSGIFLKMVSKASEDVLILDVSISKGILKSGKNKTCFTVRNEFPEIPPLESAEKICEVPTVEFVRLVNEGCTAASKPQEFPKYLGASCLKITEKDIKCVSTDGKRLSLSSYVSENIENLSENEFIVPSAELSDIAKNVILEIDDIEKITVRANASTVFFEVGDIVYSLQRVETVFPKYEKILSDQKTTTLKIKGSDFFPALERVEIISKNTPANIFLVQLDSSAGEVKLIARVAEVGVSNEKISADVEGESLLVGFNTKFFEDGVKILGDDEIEIEFDGSEGQTRMFLSGHKHDFMYMLMPARLDERDKIIEND